jgi:hypothetical protein
MKLRGRASARAVHWLRWIHVLVGLQSAAALIVYAVAGLAATWHARPGAPETPRRLETRAYAPRDGESDVALAKRLHAELALPLTDPPADWVVRRDDAGVLTFRVYSPNGMQHVRVPAPGVVQVEDARVDLATFLLNLHAHVLPPGLRGADPRLLLWSLYNELSMLALGGLALSGLTLWLATRPRAPLPFAAFVLGCASCLWIVWGSW